MRNRFNPMVFAAVYSFVVPLALGGTAAWMALSPANIGTVKDWQTLIAGVIAIVAALMGGGFVYYQTLESRRQHNALLARRHAAARSVLPLTLSALMENASTIAERLDTLRSSAVGGRVPRGTAPFEYPEADHNLIGPLKDVIETAPESVSDAIATLLSDIQVLEARLRHAAAAPSTRSTSLVLTLNIVDYIINAATIYARCAALFEYARRETDDAPSTFPSEPQLVSALNQLDFDEATDSEMYALARARARRWEKSMAVE